MLHSSNMDPSFLYNLVNLICAWYLEKFLWVSFFKIPKTSSPEILYPITGDFTNGVKLEKIVPGLNKT